MLGFLLSRMGVGSKPLLDQARAIPDLDRLVLFVVAHTSSCDGGPYVRLKVRARMPFAGIWQDCASSYNTSASTGRAPRRFELSRNSLLARRPVCSISVIKASSLGLFPICTVRIKAYCSLLVSHFGPVRTSRTMLISSHGLSSAIPCPCAHLQKAEILASLLLTVAGLKPRSSKRQRLYSLRSIGIIDCGASSSLLVS